MRLNEILKRDGVAKGMCSPYQKELDNQETVEGLVSLYVKGIRFCVDNDYPTLDFLRKHFKGQCEPFNVFIDDEVMTRNAERIVLNGECQGTLIYDGFAVARVVARHDTDAKMYVSDRAIVHVDAFDNSRLAIYSAGDRVKVRVRQFGNAKVDCIGKGISLEIINKNKYQL